MFPGTPVIEDPQRNISGASFPFRKRTVETGEEVRQKRRLKDPHGYRTMPPNFSCNFRLGMVNDDVDDESAHCRTRLLNKVNVWARSSDPCFGNATARGPQLAPARSGVVLQ